MFTGCIQAIGKVKSCVAEKGGGMQLVIETRSFRPRLGASIAVQGVCLTVTKSLSAHFSVDVIPETKRRTTLGKLQNGSRVNLEQSLKAGDSFDGHMVMGHVDATATVTQSGKRGKDIVLTVKIPRQLQSLVTEKGSVAIDGVSLTAAKVERELVTCALIPYTLSHTTLGMLRAGNKVNIEVDVLARYVERALGVRC